MRPGDLGQAAARILGYIEKGVDEGATLLVGGAEPPEGVRQGILRQADAFHRRRQLDDHRPGGDLRPGAVVIPFDDEDDAIRIANDSAYGLAGNVMSGSLERSLAVARRIRAGFIGLNGGAGYGADTPFGGYKDSGVGRQNGVAGFDQYTEIKSVAYPAQ